MPLFEYQCKCGFEFEELVQYLQGSETSVCKMCGATATKKMSRFAPVIAGGSPTESIDMTIGREASKRWQMHTDRQVKRRGDRPLQEFDLPKTKTGEYMPVMGLGDKATKETRTEYSGALQEHRKRRIEKGQKQFDTAGAF